jgi:hypothetical protein
MNKKLFILLIKENLYYKKEYQVVFVIKKNGSVDSSIILRQHLFAAGVLADGHTTPLSLLLKTSRLFKKER